MTSFADNIHSWSKKNDDIKISSNAGLKLVSVASTFIDNGR
jgi:hypothetical protein